MQNHWIKQYINHRLPNHHDGYTLFKCNGMLTKLSKTSHTHVSEIVSPQKCQHALCLTSKSVLNQSCIINLYEKWPRSLQKTCNQYESYLFLIKNCKARILSHRARGNATFDKGFVVVSPCHQNNKIPPERTAHQRTVTNESFWWISWLTFQNYEIVLLWFVLGFSMTRKKKIFSQSILKKLSLGLCLGLILFLRHVQPIGTLFLPFNLWTEYRSYPTGKNEKNKFGTVHRSIWNLLPQLDNGWKV